MRRLRTVVVGALLALGSLSLAPAAYADFVVDDLDDTVSGVADGSCDAPGGDTCTLREALLEANANVNLDTLSFSGNGTHVIASVLTVSGETVIDGNGAGNTIVDGQDATQLFLTGTEAVTFKDMRLEDGAFSSGNSGAAVAFGDDGALTNVVATSNQSTGAGSSFGGAVASLGAGNTLSIADSTISDNSLGTGGVGTLNAGGGIYAEGTLSLSDSTVSGNTLAAADMRKGAGIYASGPIEIEDSAISGNGGAVEGAGVYIEDTTAGTRTIANSTFSGNDSGTGGGGGLLARRATTLEGSTFAANTTTAGAGADVVAQSGTGVLTAQGTILASASSPACGTSAGGTISSAAPGNNVDIGTSCGLGTGDGNQQNADPDLEPLAVNAPGATATHAIPPDSPALDAAGACAGSLPADQRGVARAQGPACDAGAFELEYRTLTAATAGSGSGTVTATGIACPGDCSEGVPQGKAVTLTATPAVGSTVAWSDCDSPSGNTCTETVGADETVTATFTLIPRTLVVVPAGSGGGTVTGTGINCPADCMQVELHGTVKLLTATAAAGSTFAGWLGCDAPAGNQCTQTLDSDEMVTATFTANPPAPGGGSTTPVTQPGKKKCKKGRKLKKGKCVKKKRKKK